MLDIFYKYLFEHNAYRDDSRLPDWLYLKMLYYMRLGKKLHLINPIDFNEKIQWIKLFDRNPLMCICADKYSMKEWVEKNRGNNQVYTAKTLGIWEDTEEIVINNLPSKFVLKCTHDSGSVIICNNKSMFDLEDAKKRLSESIKKSYFPLGREWCYKNITPRIIAEEYIDAKDGDLFDYKFFCFNGEPKVIQVNYNRVKGKPILKFFDLEWNELDVKLIYDNDEERQIDKPELLPEMIRASRTLSKKFKFVRVDLYVSDSKIYCGELTFYPNCGFGRFEPDSFDRTLGDYLKL